MNRNSIRKNVKVAACCLAGIVLFGTNAMVSQATVTAGAASILSTATESQTGKNAGITMRLADYLVENTTKSETVQSQHEKSGFSVEKEEQQVQTEENDAPVVKSEFANIGVSNIDADSYINIRSEANTESEVVGKLYTKSAVTVVGTEGEWYKITSGNCEGYIKSEYIITGDEELAKSISTRVAVSNTDNLNIRDNMSTEGTVIGQVSENESLIVIEELDGWIKVATDEGDGYVSADYVECKNYFIVAESKAEEEARLRREEEARRAEIEAQRQRNHSSRSSSSSSSSSSSNSDGGSVKNYNPPSGGSGQDVVNYACQFVGNPYRYGGTSLTNGADCSGFVMAVYGAFGVGLPHSSSALRSVGYGVSPSEMQPGDIVCYSGHVAIYVGGNTVVHASTAATGIKYTSPAAYREIVAVRRIF